MHNPLGWPSGSRAGNSMRAFTFALLASAAWLPAAWAADKEKTAADYFVHSLPGAPAGPLLKMHAG